MPLVKRVPFVIMDAENLMAFFFKELLIRSISLKFIRGSPPNHVMFMLCAFLETKYFTIASATSSCINSGDLLPSSKQYGHLRLHAIVVATLKLMFLLSNIRLK